MSLIDTQPSSANEARQYAAAYDSATRALEGSSPENVLPISTQLVVGGRTTKLSEQMWAGVPEKLLASYTNGPSYELTSDHGALSPVELVQLAELIKDFLTADRPTVDGAHFQGRFGSDGGVALLATQYSKVHMRDGGNYGLPQPEEYGIRVVFSGRGAYQLNEQFIGDFREYHLNLSNRRVYRETQGSDIAKLVAAHQELKQKPLIKLAGPADVEAVAQPKVASEISRPPEPALRVGGWDLNIIRPILEQWSSGGNTCVPTSLALLEMLRTGADPEQQEGVLFEIIQRFHRGDVTRDASGWVRPSNAYPLIDHGPYTVGSAQRLGIMDVGHLEVPDYVRGWGALAGLFHFFVAKNGETLRVISPNASEAPGEFTVDSTWKRAVMVQTHQPLPARVRWASAENPYWKREGRVPKAGDSYTTAGRHELLAVAATSRRVTEQSGRQRVVTDITCIDPQTGAVIDISSDDLYRAMKKTSTTAPLVSWGIIGTGNPTS